MSSWIAVCLSLASFWIFASESSTIATKSDCAWLTCWTYSFFVFVSPPPQPAMATAMARATPRAPRIGWTLQSRDHGTAARHLRPRPVLRGALRLLRLQHLRLDPGARGVRRRAGAGARTGPPAARRPPGGHRVH